MMLKKVLLVEDIASQAAITRLSLESKGFTVKVAYESQSVLILTEEWSPDLIVIDYSLSNLDAIELCSRLKQHSNYRTIPVVIIGSENRLSTMIRAYSAGADNYVVKSREGESVLEVLIENILARRNRIHYSA